MDKKLDSDGQWDSGQKFGQCTFSSSFSEDSGQWTKTVNSSPGQGGVLVYPGLFSHFNWLKGFFW